MTSALPFDDIRALVDRLPGRNPGAVETATRDVQTSRIARLGGWLGRWSASAKAPARRPLVAVFAGTHGAAQHLPAAATPSVADRVASIGAGAATLNSLCASFDLGLKVFDLALSMPTGDIATGAALDERACAATMAFGMEAVAGGTDLLCVSGLGDAADCVAAIMVSRLCDAPLEGLVGEAERDVARRLDAAVTAGHGRNLLNPLEALRRLGGREFAAIAGAILAARMERAPVILDGKPAIAAAAVLHALRADALFHCKLAAMPAEPGWAALLRELDIDVLLDSSFAGDAGEAGAVAGGIVKAAAAALR